MRVQPPASPLGAMQVWLDFGEKYNVAPSLQTPVIRKSPTGERVVDLLQWGLIPHWAQDPTMGRKLTIARGEPPRQMLRLDAYSSHNIFRGEG